LVVVVVVVAADTRIQMDAGAQATQAAWILSGTNMRRRAYGV